MSKQIEYDKLTLEIPKPVKKLLKAAHTFSRVDFSFEEWCYKQLIFGLKDSLEGDSIDSLFPDLAGPQLIEAYGLDKVFGFKLAELTIKVPKELIDCLEAENFLGWNREVFFESAIRALICISIGHMDTEECKRFEEKYGHNIGTIYLPESLKP